MAKQNNARRKAAKSLRSSATATNSKLNITPPIQNEGFGGGDPTKVTPTSLSSPGPLAAARKVFAQDSKTLPYHALDANGRILTPRSEPRPNCPSRQEVFCNLIAPKLPSPGPPHKSLPSPPTSTPSLTSPTTTRKRKSVVFNHLPIQSAHSVPNHRLRRWSTRVDPSKTDSNHPSGLQPSFFPVSHQSNDPRKRARLSLAAPQAARHELLEAPSRRQVDLGDSAILNSPLSAKSRAKKKLARFYYTPPSLDDSTSPLDQRPTISSSSIAKQALLSTFSAFQTEEEEADSSSSSSDEAVVMSLLPGHSSIPKQSVESSETVSLPMKRAASFPHLARSNQVKLDDILDDISELRPILKKTDSSILLASTVDEGTKANGRPKCSLDSPAPTAVQKIIDAVTSKALKATNQLSTTEGASHLNTTCPTGSTSAQSHCSQAGGSGTDEGDRSESPSSPPDSNDPTSPNSQSEDVERTEKMLAVSLTSCLRVLQVSLLPPPSDMRLDPISPLATLTSPQRRKVSQLGTLVGSPREPKDVLPRVTRQNLSTEPSATKSQLRNRGRPGASNPKPCTRFHERDSADPQQGLASIPPRTPEQSPTRHALNPSRVTITLREVEEAYISLFEHLSALIHHWCVTSHIDAAEQKTRIASVFTQELSIGLGRCLLRDIENLCHLDQNRPNLSQATSGKQPTSFVRDDLSRIIHLNRNSPPISKLASSGNISSPVLKEDKTGSSTNQIRRRVAEIETGQGALKCIALLWSWPDCMVNLEDSYTERLLTLLVQIPSSDILRRKKNLTAIGLFNNVFKSQNLSPALLQPQCNSIVDAIAGTLYLSAGKSGDKGKKVLTLGLMALRQLTLQIPELISQRLPKFLDPLLASLTATESPSLRNHAVRGLGALVNCTQQEWKIQLRTTATPQCTSLPKPSSEDTATAQNQKKDALRERLSSLTLAFFSDRNTFTRWNSLIKQLGASLSHGHFAWVVSVMTTVTAILGKRIRKLNPLVTRAFMPSIKLLLTQKDATIKRLGQQIWDYFIRVMLIWSDDSLHHQNAETVWALEKVQLPFLMQIFRSSYFFQPNGAVSSTTLPETDHQATRSSTEEDPAISNTDQRNSTVPSEPQHSRDEAEILHQHSTLHHTVSAFLYGTVGFVHHNFKIPSPFVAGTEPPIHAIGPDEWLQAVAQSSRFRHLDIIWDEIVLPLLPGLLSGPVDDHRLYACQILKNLISPSINPFISTGSKSAWTWDRFLHPAFHEPPLKTNSASELCFDSFSQASFESAVKPCEIPPLDPIWICFHADKVLSLIQRSFDSVFRPRDPNQDMWPESHDTRESVVESNHVTAKTALDLWDIFVSTLNHTRRKWGLIFESQCIQAFSHLILVLEQTFDLEQYPKLLGPQAENSLKTSIHLFRHLYLVLKKQLGVQLLSHRLILTDKDKISGLSKLCKFLLTTNPALQGVRSGRCSDGSSYDALADMVMLDLITEAKTFGSPLRLDQLITELLSLDKACPDDRLRDIIRKNGIGTLIDLLKNVELGLLIEDEPPIQSDAVELVNLYLQSITNKTVIPEAVYAEFVHALTRFVLRSTPESFHRLLIGCQAGLRSTLSRRDQPDTKLLYHTMLLKLQPPNVHRSLSASALCDLILAPFKQGCPMTNSQRECLATFGKFSEQEGIQSYIGKEARVIAVLELLTPILKPISPPVPSISEVSILIPLGKQPPTDTQTTYTDSQNSVPLESSLNSPIDHNPTGSASHNNRDRRKSTSASRLSSGPETVRVTRSRIRQSMAGSSMSSSQQESSCQQATGDSECNKLLKLPNIIKISSIPSVAPSSPTRVKEESLVTDSEIRKEPRTPVNENVQRSSKRTSSLRRSNRSASKMASGNTQVTVQLPVPTLPEAKPKLVVDSSSQSSTNEILDRQATSVPALVGLEPDWATITSKNCHTDTTDLPALRSPLKLGRQICSLPNRPAVSNDDSLSSSQRRRSQRRLQPSPSKKSGIPSTEVAASATSSTNLHEVTAAQTLTHPSTAENTQDEPKIVPPNSPIECPHEVTATQALAHPSTPKNTNHEANLVVTESDQPISNQLVFAPDSTETERFDTSIHISLSSSQSASIPLLSPVAHDCLPSSSAPEEASLLPVASHNISKGQEIPGKKTTAPVQVSRKRLRSSVGDGKSCGDEGSSRISVRKLRKLPMRQSETTHESAASLVDNPQMEPSSPPKRQETVNCGSSPRSPVVSPARSFAAVVIPRTDALSPSHQKSKVQETSDTQSADDSQDLPASTRSVERSSNTKSKRRSLRLSRGSSEFEGPSGIRAGPVHLLVHDEYSTEEIQDQLKYVPQNQLLKIQQAIESEIRSRRFRSELLERERIPN